MNERDLLIQNLIKEKGGTREQYLQLLDSIAYHESAHTMDPTTKQKGGGPGRGKYQFETGKNAGGITAAKRLKKYYRDNGNDVPQWLQKASNGDDLDVSTLTANQQDALFLGNMRMHPKADLSKVMDGSESTEDFWANNHWAGNKVDRNKRIEAFKESQEAFNNSTKKSNIDFYKDVKNTRHGPYRKNEDGSTSSHLMSQADNKAFPTLFQEKDNSWTELPWRSAMDRAEKQGELYSFKDDKEASDFAGGAWKGSGYTKLNENQYVLGGNINSNETGRNLNAYNTGGLHSQNPHGGIPQGIGVNNKMNTVEQGETSFKIKGNKYIFSNRIKF